MKVFSVTRARERELFGETVTDWIRAHPEIEVFDKIVTQTSDREFHCLCITLFFRQVAAPTATKKRRLAFSEPT